MIGCLRRISAVAGNTFLEAVRQKVFAVLLVFALAMMGGESMMRGYYLGRFRDKNMLATQAEYRFLPFAFSNRWGAAAFVLFGSRKKIKSASI